MRKVCERYVKSPTRPFSPALESLAPTPPHPGIITVANAFLKLQEARHTADYDLSASFTRKDARDLLDIASQAKHAFDEIVHLPETTVFLTALLLDDKWTRRG